jgi:hypothetical protein
MTRRENFLDENLSELVQSIREYLHILESMQNMVLHSWSATSPVEPAIEIAIDILLRLSLLLKEDFRAIATPNPDLLFSERWQDVLGNPKQLKRVVKVPILGPDIVSASLLKSMAEYLVTLKRSFQVSFHGKLWEPSLASARVKIALRLEKTVRKYLSELSERTQRAKQARHSTQRRLASKRKRQRKK